MWQQYGYALLPATPASRQLAERVARLVADEQATEEINKHDAAVAAEKGGGENSSLFARQIIAGQVQQLSYNSLPPSDAVTPACQDISEQLRAVMETALLQVQEPSKGRVPLLSWKVLLAQAEQGEQAVHWDSESNGMEHMSFLLYCTPTHSTSLPRFPSLTFSAAPQDKGIGKQQAFLLEKQFFHNVPVQTGDMLILSHDTPHFGSSHSSSLSSPSRIVLLDMYSRLSSSEQPVQDDQQWFSWQYIHWYFEDKLRTALALLTHKQFTPMLRATSDDRKDYKASLTEVQQAARAMQRGGV